LGQLKCVGNSVHLKNEYGSGYRVNLVTKSSASSVKLKQFVQTSLPASSLLADNADSLTYIVPMSHVKDIPNFFNLLQSQAKELIKDWSVSHTSLEEVFHIITSKGRENEQQHGY